MIIAICERCKWRYINKPNKCDTCKKNSLTGQDFYVREVRGK